jgi:hypothetical protein
MQSKKIHPAPTPTRCCGILYTCGSSRGGLARGYLGKGEFFYNLEEIVGGKKTKKKQKKNKNKTKKKITEQKKKKPKN